MSLNRKQGSITKKKKQGKIFERLKKAAKLKKTKNAYMLIFLHDDDIDTRREDKILEKYLKHTSECANLDIYCIFRDQSKYMYLKSGKKIWIKVNN